MGVASVTPASLRTALAGASAPTDAEGTDFKIATHVGRGLLGRARNGDPAVLVPLDAIPTVAGRRGGGFSLRPLHNVAFDFEGRRWEQGAAVLECTETELLDSFLVLVIDLVRRLDAEEVTWATVLACVDEWQALLTRRAVLSVARQLGLWAELWLISLTTDPDRLVAAWRGPEGDATDFFIDGVSLELKASRQRNVHHVSLRQAQDPVGEHDAYVMSIWVGVDPGHGRSLPELVDEMLSRVADPPAFLRHVAQVGYVPADREQYSTRFVPLEVPLLFRADDVPRVRVVDPGVSQVRYQATLDPERAQTDDVARRLWHHFCRIEPTTIR